MKRRYDTRLEIDDFIRPILNLEILDLFQNKDLFPTIPVDFGLDSEDDQSLVEDPSQVEYWVKWKHLFMYETYSALMNSRRSDSKNEELTLSDQLKDGDKQLESLNQISHMKEEEERK